MMRVRLSIVALFLALAACKPAKKNPNVLEGGQIAYAVNGISRGTVAYRAGVRREHAATVGDWLREKGWFLTREEARSALTGKAKPSWGTGPATRGRGDEPLATVSSRAPDGLEVIVYTDPGLDDSTDVLAFGAESSSELTKRIGKPVRFVIRAETKRGTGVAWNDTFWDADQDAARSNGK